LILLSVFTLGVLGDSFSLLRISLCPLRLCGSIVFRIDLMTTD